MIVVSIELYFLINLLADFFIMGTAAWGLGCFRPGRVALGACLGAVYALLAEALPGLRDPAAQLSLLLAVAFLISGRLSGYFAFVTGLTLGTNALVAGACACHLDAPLLAVALPPVLSMQGRLRRRALSALPASVEVVHRGVRARFCACVDTGNRLTEPFSGQPVMIASARLVRGILPEGGYRLVSYGSVGGQGLLKCFRPDKIYILRNGRRRQAPEAWIAVFPNRLPGVAQALAPAEFIYI